MQKTILVTGSTDGIGYETAKLLLSLGHRVLLHGRSQKKLEQAKKAFTATHYGGAIETYVADLSRLADVDSLAKAVSK